MTNPDVLPEAELYEPERYLWIDRLALLILGPIVFVLGGALGVLITVLIIAS